ncbi:MAG TPA: hypothetical protein VGQ38_09620 [Gaiellaceae bacterium]|nr:hypothetical protein [Gaiellaceae bacterium]
MSTRVEVRAFRGTHRSAVYRSHSIERIALRRIVAVAIGERLPTLGQLSNEESLTFDAPEARRIAAEITQLRSAALLLDLDQDLAAIARVANWCGHARGTAWLTVRQLEE